MNIILFHSHRIISLMDPTRVIFIIFHAPHAPHISTSHRNIYRRAYRVQTFDVIPIPLRIRFLDSLKMPGTKCPRKEMQKLYKKRPKDKKYLQVNLIKRSQLVRFLELWYSPPFAKFSLMRNSQFSLTFANSCHKKRKICFRRISTIQLRPLFRIKCWILWPDCWSCI